MKYSCCISAIKRILFYYRRISIFVSFHLFMCSLLLPGMLRFAALCGAWWRYAIPYIPYDNRKRIFSCSFSWEIRTRNGRNAISTSTTGWLDNRDFPLDQVLNVKKSPIASKQSWKNTWKCAHVTNFKSIQILQRLIFQICSENSAFGFVTSAP